MTPQYTAGLIRLGILALPLAGLLALVGTIAGFATPEPDVDPRGAAQAASTTGYFLSQFAGNVLSVTLVIFGLIALFAYLAHTRVGLLASLAMILSVLGLCLLLSFLGTVTYAIPALAQEYLNGQQNAIQMTDAIFSKTFLLLIIAGLLYFVGFILFSVAIWRSGVLPKGAAVALALAGLLLALPANIPIVNVIGTVLLIIAGGWIAVSVLRQPGAQAEGANQPRVR